MIYQIIDCDLLLPIIVVDSVVSQVLFIYYFPLMYGTYQFFVWLSIIQNFFNGYISQENIPGYFRLSEEEKEALMVSATNELHDIERTLLKHIAMELRDEEPHQFVNAFTSGKERSGGKDVITFIY